MLYNIRVLVCGLQISLYFTIILIFKEVFYLLYHPALQNIQHFNYYFYI